MNDQSATFADWSAINCFLIYFTKVLSFVINLRPIDFYFGKDHNSQFYLQVNDSVPTKDRDNQESQLKFMQVQAYHKHYYQPLNPSR